jgi:hypothetical protein
VCREEGSELHLLCNAKNFVEQSVGVAFVNSFLREKVRTGKGQWSEDLKERRRREVGG